jgi:hypothetical protein
MEKKVVTFNNGVEFFKRTLDKDLYPDLAKYVDENDNCLLANVYGVLDHPKLGYQSWVRTSIVIKINSDSSFETLNTIYKPS